VLACVFAGMGVDVRFHYANKLNWMCSAMAFMNSGGKQLPICFIPSSNSPEKQNHLRVRYPDFGHNLGVKAGSAGVF